MLHTIAAGTRDISQQQTTYIAQASDAGFTGTARPSAMPSRVKAGAMIL